MINALVKLMNSPSEFTGPVNFGSLVKIGMPGLARTIISMAEQNLSCQPIVSQKDNLKEAMS